MMEQNVIGWVTIVVIALLFFTGSTSIIIDMIIHKDFKRTNVTEIKQENAVDHPTYYFRKKEVPELLAVTEDFFDSEIEYED